MTFQIAGIDTCGLQGASRPHLTLSTISWNMTFGQLSGHCPDSVRTTVQMSYSKKSLTMSSVVVTHLVGHRYQYQRFGMSFGVKPTYSQYVIDPPTISAQNIKLQKIGFKPPSTLCRFRWLESNFLKFDILG